jgi:hypothetical protein
MTFQQILDRDVPQIVAYAKVRALGGIIGQVKIYYRHEEITGLLDAFDSSFLLSNGWKPTGVVVPCNVPYMQWNSYLCNRLGNCPLFV